MYYVLYKFVYRLFCKYTITYVVTYVITSVIPYIITGCISVVMLTVKYYLKHFGQFVYIYSSNWESNGKDSIRQSLVLYLSLDSHQELYTFIQSGSASSVLLYFTL